MYQVYLPTVQGGSPPPIVRPSAIDEINSYRQYHGLETVTKHAGLMVSAQAYADDMRDRSVFGHAPDWLERIIPHYPDWQALGEILAAGYPDAASAMKALYYSPSHRDVILSDLYKDVGFGYAQGGTRYGHWWCVHMGSRNIGQRGIRRVYTFCYPGETISAVGHSRINDSRGVTLWEKGDD